MTCIIGDGAKELIGMFLADAGVTVSVLGLVAIAAGLKNWMRVSPEIAGCLLVAGSLLILVEAVMREGKRGMAAFSANRGYR